MNAIPPNNSTSDASLDGMKNGQGRTPLVGAPLAVATGAHHDAIRLLTISSTEVQTMEIVLEGQGIGSVVYKLETKADGTVWCIVENASIPKEKIAKKEKVLYDTILFLIKEIFTPMNVHLAFIHNDIGDKDFWKKAGGNPLHKSGAITQMYFPSPDVCLEFPVKN